MAYLNHALDTSATIHGIANAALTAPACKAVALNSSGKIILPAASGDYAIGIVIADTEDVAAGGGVDIQIKDTCYGIAGEAITAGALVMAHTDGTLKVATAGKYALGVALEGAAKDALVKIHIDHATVPAA